MESVYFLQGKEDTESVLTSVHGGHPENYVHVLYKGSKRICSVGLLWGSIEDQVWTLSGMSYEARLRVRQGWLGACRLLRGI